MFNMISTLLARYSVVILLPTLILFVPQIEAQQPSSPPSESHDAHGGHITKVLYDDLK